MSTGTTMSIQTNIVPDILCMSSIHGMQRNLDQIGSFMFILLLYMFEYDLHSILNVSMRWLWTFFECTFLSTRPPQHPLRAWRSAFVLRQIRMESCQESFVSRSGPCQGQDTTADGKSVEKKNRLGSGLKAGCVASRGGWRLSGSQCSKDYHFSRLHLSSSAVAVSSWYSSCHFESEIP